MMHQYAAECAATLLHHNPLATELIILTGRFA